MAWRIEYAASAEKQLSKLDKPIARNIMDYLDQQIAPLEDVRSRGKALTGPLGGYWRYRVGHYRVVCEIRDDRLVVLVLRIAHRKAVYR